VIENQVGGSQARFQVGTVSDPIAREEDRQFVFVGQAQNNFEQVLAIIVKTILVGIEVGGTETHRISPVNLGAKFQLDFSGIYFCGR
jgi:hypothetical protein